MATEQVTLADSTLPNPGHVQPSPSPGGREHVRRHSQLRHSVELAVGLLLFVLAIRTFLAEAYIVPTGSMATALAGNHKTTACPSCGFSVLVGRGGTGTLFASEEDDREASRHYRQGCCPNCGHDQLRLEDVDECNGDRLLVHKHVFDLRPPRRWEMIVFRNPREETSPTADTLVKRVVGLPGERVRILDGDVYANGQIARKDWVSLRAMRSLVHDNDFLPKDAPERFRWQAEPTSGWRGENEGRNFRVAPTPKSATYDWLSYHHLVRRADLGPQRWHETYPTDFAGYNANRNREYPVHDFIAATTLLARSSGWLALAITDGIDDALLEIPVGLQAGHGRVRATPCDKSQERLRKEAGIPSTRGDLSWRLELDRPTLIEWGLVDRRLFLAIDGVQPTPPIDLVPAHAAARRRTGSRPFPWGGRGPIALGAKGLDLHVSQLRVYRDVHYLGSEGGESYVHGARQDAQLGEGEYFVLGDNSSNSYDSRCWKSGPAVRHEDLIGKAFLVHLPSRVIHWGVGGRSLGANVPDWERMRWLP